MLTDQAKISDRRDAEIAQYKSVCAWAVLGLIIGLLSPLALVSELLLAVPLFGIAVCLLGLWRISRHAGELIGRKAAVAGLILCCLFAAATGSHRLHHKQMLAREAEQFVSILLKEMAANRPYNACQLFLDRDERRVLGDDLEDFYRDHPKLRATMDEMYLTRPAVEKLLAAGETAKVQDVRTVGFLHHPDYDNICQVYTISYEEDGRPATMLLKLLLRRKKHEDSTASWKVANALIEGVDEF